MKPFQDKSKNLCDIIGDDSEEKPKKERNPLPVYIPFTLGLVIYFILRVLIKGV